MKKTILFLFLILGFSSIVFSGVVSQDSMLEDFKISNQENLTEKCEDLCSNEVDYLSCETQCQARDDNCFEIQEGVIVLEQGFTSIKGITFDVPICQVTEEGFSKEPEMRQSYGEVMTFEAIMQTFGLNQAKEYEETMRDNRLQSDDSSKRDAIFQEYKGFIILGINFLVAVFGLIGLLMISRDFYAEVRRPENEYKAKNEILFDVAKQWAIYVIIFFVIVAILNWLLFKI